MMLRACCACAVVLAWLLLCLCAWQRYRREREPDAPAMAANAVLVLHASQSGMAAELAQASARALRQDGVPAHVASLDRIDARQLANCSRALFLASTYGEGDPPDAAAAFAGTVMASGARLDGLRYAVLALGDRSYANFCGFGRRLADWLQASGAAALFDTVEVDRGDPAALRHWRRQLAMLAGRADTAADADADADWTCGAGSQSSHAVWELAERVLVNPGSSGDPCYHLALAPRTPVNWQAGDIAEIFVIGPDGEPVRRDYSIASLPADGAIHLLVRQRRMADGRAGLGSGWLTADAPLGAEVRLRIRANPNFHTPADDRPMILIGNGTGIAGLRAHLKARAHAGRRRNWLLFGERHAAHDRPYADDLETWRSQGLIERLDLVYSRETAQRRYVQHALAAAADQVRAWIGAGAAVYVCGSASGMAGGVDAVLRDILGAPALAKLTREGRYRRDVY